MVIIRRDNRKRWWAGHYWSIHKEDAAEYAEEYASLIIKKRFGGGIVEYKPPPGSDYGSRQRKIIVGNAIMEEMI